MMWCVKTSPTSLINIAIDLSTEPQQDHPVSTNALPPGGFGTILVIDDDDIVRRSLLRVLKGERYTGLQARDGEAGLALIKEGGTIDLVLLDLTLPGMTGIETCRELRRLKPKLPVVLMSGLDEDAAARLAELQATGFLTKPLTAESVLAQVRSVLASRPAGE
jgi:CheY-like chemotaxis protein